MNRLSIAVGAACATLAIGSVQAAVDPSESSIAACSRLPLSERGICKQEALSAAPMAQRTPGTTALNGPQRAALKSENERYRARLAACNRMPLSERTTCVSTAGIDATLKTTG
jgi:hypothetical protein